MNKVQTRSDLDTPCGQIEELHVVAASEFRMVQYVKWSCPPKPSEHRCEIRLHQELDDGGYSAYVPELPGVVSEGETEQEAVGNISEALRGALRTYLDSEQPIPWRKEVEPLQIDEVRTWIVVDV